MAQRRDAEGRVSTDSMSSTVAGFHASQDGLENNQQNAEKITLCLLRQKAAECLGQGLSVKKERKGCLYRELLVFQRIGR